MLPTPNSRTRRPDGREADERLRWATIASVWAHLLLFVGFWVAPPLLALRRPEPPPPEEPIVVVRMAPIEHRQTPEADPASSRQPSPATADRAPQAATTAMAEAPRPIERPVEQARTPPPPAKAPPAPAPEPEPERTEEQLKRFVRTEDKSAAPEPDADSELISSSHHVAIDRKRAQVFDPQRGDSQASPSLPSPSVRRQLDGAQADVRGAPTVDAAETRAPTRAGGSGHAGTAVAKGAPLPGDSRQEGGEAAAAAAGGARTSRGDAAASRQSMPAAPAGQEAPESKGTPSWWEPLAARMDVAEPEPLDAERVPTPSVSEHTRVAVLERPGLAEDAGGTDRPDTTDDAPAPGVKGDAELDPDAGETERAEALVEPVDAVREALGWGRLDREKIKPHPGSAPAPSSMASVVGSSQTVLDQPIDDVVMVSAEGTPLGTYTEQIYGVLQTRWYALDLDVHDKALGLQGEVTVIFRVLRTGKVTDVKVKKSSGIYNLDRMAVEAVPAHLPRIPREIEGPYVVQHVTFSYRNPFIASAGLP